MTINYEGEVKHINIEKQRASSITLTDGRVKKADAIIVNAELPYAYEHLLPSEPLCRKLKRKQYSCSALIFHWGIDAVYPQLETHNLFFAHDYQDGFDQVLNRSKPPAQPHFYVQAPTRTDSTRAPMNQDTLSVMIPINHIDPLHPVKWGHYREEVRKYVVSRLQQAGLTDIEKHIKFEVSCLPTDWQNNINLPLGAIYGLHHNLSQLGPFRPRRVHRRYKNLFFVGASTHPGSGFPSVLTSSLFTSQAVLEYLA